MLLGRDAELAALSERLAGNETTVVVGEAGIGKTTLMREAATRCERPAFEGGGIPTLSWMPYLPLARAFGEKPPKGDAAAVARWLVDEVGEGILVVDDLQWADRQTLAVIPLIVDRVALVVALRKGDPATAARLEELPLSDTRSVELRPLGTGDAVDLVRQLRPDLPDDAVGRVVRRAGGNPLMLEQLALGNGSEEKLRLGLRARLRPHSRVAREAAARLALIGRPAERALLGAGVDDLLEAGLLVERDGRIELCHDLIGRAALEEFDTSEVRSLQSELAGALHDPGEAARHHAQAGEQELAHAKALEAARGSEEASERASHLGLAAATARGPEADDLRIEAAEALNEAADPAAALDLCNRVDLDHHSALAPRAALIRGRAHFQLRDRQAAEAAVAEGLAHARGTGTAVEVALRLEEVHFRIRDWKPAVQGAKVALELARDIGAEEARAEFVLALALLSSDSPECIGHAERAMDRAKLEDDESLELEAASCLAAAFNNFGRTREAHRIYVQAAARARALGLRLRELHASVLQAHIELYDFGDLRRAHALHRQLLEEPVALGEWLTRTRANFAVCLAQAGKDREASQILDEARAVAMDDGETRAYLAWAAGEVHWLAGRALDALDAVKDCREGQSPIDVHARVVEGWAALDAGRPSPPRVDHVPFRLLAGTVPESAAIEQLANGDAVGAEASFLAAARLWAGLVVFEELRCLWGAGIAALESGAADRARAQLLETQVRARDHGYEPLCSRITRSLRKIGTRKAERRLPGKGALTARESEVLELVGAGLSTHEIAARLGVASSTIDSQVKSAMRKLGTHTRAQAALAAAGDRN